VILINIGNKIIVVNLVDYTKVCDYDIQNTITIVLWSTYLKVLYYLSYITIDFVNAVKEEVKNQLLTKHFSSENDPSRSVIFVAKR